MRFRGKGNRDIRTKNLCRSTGAHLVFLKTGNRLCGEKTLTSRENPGYLARVKKDSCDRRHPQLWSKSSARSRPSQSWFHDKSSCGKLGFIACAIQNQKNA